MEGTLESNVRLFILIGLKLDFWKTIVGDNIKSNVRNHFNSKEDTDVAPLLILASDASYLLTVGNLLLLFVAPKNSTLLETPGRPFRIFILLLGIFSWFFLLAVVG